MTTPPDLEGLRNNWRLAAQWMPQMDPVHRADEYENWQRAVQLTFGWLRSKRKRDEAGTR